MSLVRLSVVILLILPSVLSAPPPPVLSDPSHLSKYTGIYYEMDGCDGKYESVAMELGAKKKSKNMPLAIPHPTLHLEEHDGRFVLVETLQNSPTVTVDLVFGKDWTTYRTRDGRFVLVSFKVNMNTLIEEQIWTAWKQTRSATVTRVFTRKGLQVKTTIGQSGLPKTECKFSPI